LRLADSFILVLETPEFPLVLFLLCRPPN
jgi:hypothetical protein